MRRFTALLLAALMLLSLAACGQGASAGGSAQNAAGDPTPEEEAPELPEPEPYEISDPMVMPEGGVRDGVTYAAYDGIVEHLFFHPVVAYPELAFDGDAQANGIDDYMVTVDEYNKILQSVYDKGYVLVDIGDVWSETTGEDGQPKMVRNTLYLPEGKKPLILSYDDTNYYEYMLANGFTYKLVIGEDGKIASWGKDPQGNEVTSRDLDAIPILDKFVEEHPDFSPFGARKRDIIGQFLVEASVVSCCGGVIGIVLGCFLSAVLGNLLLAKTQNSYMPTVEQFTVLPSAGLVIGAFLFSALLGIIFGLYPANKASNLQPVDALRTQ